ncbi:MAG TPA: Bax inhibitor-1 family protein [Kofleriaceae bacterium]|nr:Bax inhibitor-1 family protein [Kofleriaceae bacterium]
MRKTYGLLGVALIAFAVLTAGMMKFATETSLYMSSWAFGSPIGALVAIALFIGAATVAQRLAFSESSRGLQLAGLALYVGVQSFLLQPLLWILIANFGNRMALHHGVLMSGHVGAILMQAVVITLSIFVGLTLTVFITRKDFSFLRGVLTIGSFAVLGLCLASWLFGFSLGAFFCGFVVLLMAGYILMQTSQIMSSFPPTAHVGAALLLFSTVATMFRFVLMILMQASSNRR